MADPQAEFRGLMGTVGSSEGSFKAANPPYRMSASRMEARDLLPHLGEHTEEVLREIAGYDDKRIEAMRRDGAFGSPRASPG